MRTTPLPCSQMCSVCSATHRQFPSASPSPRRKSLMMTEFAAARCVKTHKPTKKALRHADGEGEPLPNIPASRRQLTAKIGAPPLVRRPNKFAATSIGLHLVSGPHREDVRPAISLPRRKRERPCQHRDCALRCRWPAGAIIARLNATLDRLTSANLLLGPMSRS